VRLVGTGRAWSRTGRGAALLGLFGLALAVRSLHAADLGPLVGTPDEPAIRMSHRYEAQARDIQAGAGILFPRDANPRDTGPIARPPGYALFLAGVYTTFGREGAKWQRAQNLLDSLAPVLLFLLGEALLGPAVGLASGLIFALTPHFAYYANVRLPDEPCVVLVLAGMLCVILGRGRRAALGWHALGGLAFGLSTWLRPNTLALAAFMALGLLALEPWPAAKWRALVLAGTAAVVVAPITLRNYLVYDAFVPVSTNMGIVLWEGIADAGGARFGAFSADREVARDEARLFGDPRYREWWASPDGVARDRFRVRRALAVIRDNPLWFGRAMLARMGQMLDYPGNAPPLVAATSRLRALVRAVQLGLTGLLLLAVAAGIGLVGLLAPRRALLLGIVPFAYLVLQAPMHLEFRVTLPMHALLALFAGAAAVATVSLARAPLRTAR
jgi:4-amino-4-deoxy-L-arabinose transferase-like glycosyltransferase